jgi:5-methylcytosine-specific restriction endonuclease McrA
LVRTIRRTESRPDLREALVSGEASLDRIEALPKIMRDVGLLPHREVAGVRGEAAKQTRVTAAEERRTASEQFPVMQPSLDESWWKLWGGLDGPLGSLVDKVLTERADELSLLPDGVRGEASWRRAGALTELCVSGDAPPVQVTVFVDADQASETNGESGVVLDAGAKVGRQALQAILCDATTEVIARSEDGRPMEYGRHQRTAPPGLKRAILHRDANTCAADGCGSRCRLEIHHKTPRSDGGETNPDDLVTPCWFHHHVVVHQRGYLLYTHPDTGRVRFRQPEG